MELLAPVQPLPYPPKVSRGLYGEASGSFYIEMKENGKVRRKVTIALPALACKWFLDTENEYFYDTMTLMIPKILPFLGRLKNPRQQT